MNAGKLWDDSPEARPTPACAPGARTAGRRRWIVLALCVAAGVIVRWTALVLAPGHAFLSDHVDYMTWSQYAYEHGPTRLYDLPAETLINVNAPPWWLAERFRVPPSMANRFAVTPCPSYSGCNYPPLANYAFWVQGWLWSVLESEPVTNDVAPNIAASVGHTGGPVTSRVANTFTARFVNGILAIIADFAMAIAAALLVRKLLGRTGYRTAATWAFALVVLAPPIVLDSAFWNQTDAWLACALVWSLYWLVSARYAWAGVAFGVALMLKAQAIVFTPVLAYVFLSLVFMTDGSWRRAGRLWRFAAGAAVTVVLLAAPFSLASIDHPEYGWARWGYRAYVVPVLSDFPFTTLKAFNVWWLDFAAYGQTTEALDAEATVAGLSKDLLGKVALAAALLAAGAVCAWRWRWSQISWPVMAFFVMCAAFLFPTRVHERYIYYCFPFLIVMAVTFRRWIPALIALLLVGTFELTWYLWYAAPDAEPWAVAPSGGVLAWSVVLACLALASFVYALAAAIPGVPRTERGE